MKYVLSILIVALLVFIFTTFQDHMAYVERQEKIVEAAQAYSTVDLGGPYDLVDHNGQDVTEKDFDHVYKLIYFGFTFCPSICPTELQKITEAYLSLPEKTRAYIQPIFISVDPERDTPKVMREYVDLFHKDWVGLTGTPEQIEKAKQAYRIYAAKVQEDWMREYTIDHSSFIYFMSPSGQLLDIYKIETPGVKITESIQNILG